MFQKLKSDTKLTLKESWVSEEKIDLMMDLVYLIQPKLSVEIGVFAGSSSLPILTTLRYVQEGNFVGIDAWSNKVAIQNMGPDDPNRAWWSTVNMQWAYQLFQGELNARHLSPFCTTLRCSSEIAAPFVDEEIDFLHLDGDYSEEGSLLDVKLYLPKVKSGGYILLSNLLLSVDGHLPKMKTYWKLCENCEIVCEIDEKNSVLFRKNHSNTAL